MLQAIWIPRARVGGGRVQSLGLGFEDLECRIYGFRVSVLRSEGSTSQYPQSRKEGSGKAVVFNGSS